ncbi:FxsA family protein [Mobilicoccus pelagius]|uniref:FxsA family protein n=1 Tax=Mobilicoccus pelagius NBRC 104925 TaxID=1089455 RepID=H5UTE6_9MICO|nr:FxsA family protein [Mobilicoccus pelagius]GAB49004.1 hypothetical protein MOPEL_096_00110 [Mobilicoccus pelagius NBRC 104925]
MSSPFPPRSGPRIVHPGPQLTGSAPRGRRRLRPTLLAVVVLAVLLPVVEVAALVLAGRSIGVLPTVLVLLVVAVLGLWLMKREGLSAWRSLTEATRAGRMPTAEVANAAIVLFAGALLVLPGFLTDVAALVLLLPVARPAAARLLHRAVERRMDVRANVVRSVRLGDPTPPVTPASHVLPHVDLRPDSERR